MALVPPHTHPRHEHAQYADAAEVAALTAGKVSKAGDTMTGLLILSADPATALGAATKQYADARETAAKSYADTQSALKVAKAGDTMTGALILDAGALALRLRAGPTADHVYMGFFADSAALEARSGYIGYGGAGSTALNISNEMTNGNISLATNGTGRVSVSADPTSALHVATKQYADGLYNDATQFAVDQDQGRLALSGGTLTGLLSISVNNMGLELYGSTPWLRLHHPGVNYSVLALRAGSGLAIRDGLASGLAPLQIGTPTNSDDAARVDWVQGRYARGTYTTGALTASTNMTYSVPFGKTFAATPTVVVTPQTGVSTDLYVTWWVTGTTTTGFTLNVRRANTTAMTFNWIAITD